MLPDAVGRLTCQKRSPSSGSFCDETLVFEAVAWRVAWGEVTLLLWRLHLP